MVRIEMKEKNVAKHRYSGLQSATKILLAPPMRMGYAKTTE